MKRDKKLSSARALTWWTFGALSLVCLVIVGGGGIWLFEHIEESNRRIQIASNAEYGSRFAAALESQLRGGMEPESVLFILQRSFEAAPPDLRRYLCVVSDDGRILCHPRRDLVGSEQLRDMPVRGSAGRDTLPYHEWAMQGRVDGYLLDEAGRPTEMVRRIPVEGAAWQVLVHTDVEALRAETNRLRAIVLMVLIPIGIGFVVAGTLVVRLLGRRYEQEIEEANRRLEENVRSRTAQLEKTVRQLQETRNALQTNEKMSLLGQLVAGIAHEVNNPLNAISTYATLLEDDELDAEERRRAQRGIVRSVERCSLLVRNLLTFARNDPPSPQRISLDEVIETALGFCSYELRKGSIVLQKDLETPGPEIHGDQVQLEQVLLNLVINAAEALQEQPEPRRIRMVTEGDGEFVRIVVEDNGPGLSPSIERRLFEPFQTTKPEGKGTGLGLSLCRRFVEHHGGDIYYEPTTDQGARFVVELPLAGKKAERPEPVTASQQDREEGE